MWLLKRTCNFCIQNSICILFLPIENVQIHFLCIWQHELMGKYHIMFCWLPARHSAKLFCDQSAS